jgi:Flp pilus assembly protein TadD
VGLGRALTFAGTNYGWLAPHEAFARAERESEEALRLAPNLVDAHSLRGDILAWYRWQWQEAELAYKKSLELGGDYDLGYTLLLSVLGRHEEAVHMIEGAINEYPRDPWIRSNAAWRFLSAGEYAQTIEQANMALEIDDRFGDAFSSRGWAYLATGDVEQAISDFQRNIALNGRTASTLASLAVAEARSGDTQTARQLLDEMLAAASSVYVPAEEIARVYVALAEFDSAFEWLERAHRDRSRGLIFLKVQVSSQPIRTDPRFEELRRRMNL